MENMTQKQIEQYNDVVNFLNFVICYFEPFANRKRLFEHGIKYAKSKNYDVKFIREKLMKELKEEG